MSTSPPSAAAVLEYICLFTHDLRRKQKRWQDGRLKYHAFNNRVMVYDERGNFVGDMHWRHDYAFDEGEEIELERGGVIVQVSSLVGRMETDLSELLDKRVKEKEQRHFQKLSRSPAPAAVLPRPGPRPSAIPPDHFQLRHRPLHQVIGPPTGHHGKALVPKESPFEQRQEAAAAAESLDERAAKRRKHEDPPPSKSGYATALFGQSLTLSATPASSVPMKRRPRPELNLDPPGQAEHPSAREELNPDPRENPRMARHLNQKSGYAQGLFGQSLTLSHTPVSSVPPRRQPWHKPSSSVTHDTDGCESHDDPQPALREQPKVSRHFNQPASRPQEIGLEKKTSANRKSLIISNDLAEDSHLKDKGVTSRDHDVEVLKYAAPEYDNVIEIDDPGPVPVQVQQPRREEDTRNTGRLGKQTIDRSTMTTSRQEPSRGKSISSRPVEQEDEQKNKSEKREEPTRHKRTKPVTTKSATKRRTADHAAPRTREDPTHSITTSRRADEHVTELKLKSRKRGLLMISDAPKIPRRQATDNSAGPSDGTEPHDANARARECEDDEPGKNVGRNCAQRTISTELGEFNDLSGSPTPEIEETPVCYGEASSEDDSGKWERPMADILPEPDKELPDDDYVVSGEDAVIHQATTHLSPPPKKAYDPYLLPSSAEEEVPFPWPASSPGNKSPPHNRRFKMGPPDRTSDAHEAGDKPNAASRTKQQRPSRRRLILEDDEEPYALPRGPEKTLVILGDTEDDTPAMNEAASTNWAKPKKTAEAKKRKSRTQDSMADLEVDVDESVEAIKHKAKKKHVQANLELQDEQAGKRRRSTRQKRHRVDGPEEPALASDLDVSEEEVPKKRQRRNSKASDNRPRLERINKNIKSRELIGFNLAVLNAPLGPRGIGMPFSNLSSRIDESIPRRMSNQAVMEASSDPVIEDGDETSIPFNNDATKCRPNRIVVDESSTAGLSELPTSPTSTPPTVETSVFEHTRTNEDPPRIVENALEASPVQAQCEAVATEVKKQLVAQKSVPGTASGSSVPNTRNDRSSHTPNAPETNEPTGFIPSQGHHIVVEQKVNDCDTTKVQANAHIPQAARDSDSAVSAVSTDNPPAAPNSNPTDRKQRSNSEGRSSQDMKTTQVVLESTEITQTTKATVDAAAISVAPLQASIVGLQRRLPTDERANSEPEVHKSKAGTTGSTGSNENATIVAQVALAAPAQKPIPAIRQQPSTTAQEDGAKPEGAHDKPVGSEDIRVERTAGPATRPRVTAPFKKPTPAVRRQPATTTAANQIHTSSTGEEPDTIEDAQSNSAYASAARFAIDAPLQKPTLAPVRPSSNREDNTKEEFDTSGENPETMTAAPSVLIQRQNSFGLRRPTATSRRVNNITGVRPQAEAPENQTTDSAAKAPVKIVNPASRGRKAALAADAVGQVPQRILPPTQPPLLVPISTADLACTPYEPPPKEPERPKRKMKFPGFQSARGEGPWSREAFDLLESGRPG